MKKQDELTKALNQALLFASRRMVVLEQLTNKSPDYRAGFFDGIEHQTDFLIALLTPSIVGIKESLKKIERSAPIP